MYARRNSQIQLPPAMVGPLTDFVLGHQFAKRRVKKVFPVDLTGWRYGEDVEDLHPDLRVIEVEVVPDYLWGKGRPLSEKPGVRGSYWGPEDYHLELVPGDTNTPQLRVRTSQHAEDMAAIVHHELRHHAQQLLSALRFGAAGQVFGKPKAGLPRVKSEEARRAGLGGWATSPVEFYSQLGDLAAFAARRLTDAYMKEVATWSPQVRQYTSALGAILGEEPEIVAAEPLLAPEAFFRQNFLGALQGFGPGWSAHARILENLAEQDPGRYRKMLSEVYVQSRAIFLENVALAGTTRADARQYLDEKHKARQQERAEWHEQAQTRLSAEERRQHAARKGARGRRKREATFRKLHGMGWAEARKKGLMNPLVGWDYVGKPFFPGEIDRATRPMLSENAPEVYAEKLQTTRLPIHVVIGRQHPARRREHQLRRRVTDFQTPAENLVEKLAKEGKTVLWLQQPLGSLFRSVGRDPAEVMAIKRGGRGRVSPMTPFTLLHRMGDAIRRDYPLQVKDIGHAFQHLDWIGLVDDEQHRRRLYSSGVDTLAGRNGWFTSWQEATSDLWAKYLLTGKIAYDPEAPPLDGSPLGPTWEEKELWARKDYARGLHHYFPKWLEAAKGSVFVISA